MSGTEARPEGTGTPSPGPYRRARRAFGRWRRSVADPNNLAAKVDKQRAQLDRQATQIAELKSSVAALGKRLHPVEHASAHREVEHGGLAIQIGHAALVLEEAQESAEVAEVGPSRVLRAAALTAQVALESRQRLRQGLTHAVTVANAGAAHKPPPRASRIRTGGERPRRTS